MKQYGRYKHFKGNEYFVIGTAMHTETHESLVIYTDKEGKKAYARPVSNFEDTVEVGGKTVNRFEKISFDVASPISGG